MDTSRACDNRDHDQCDGSALIFDQDGPSRYVCACHCHNTSSNERRCPNCRGTGYLHDVRHNGLYSTEPGQLPGHRDLTAIINELHDTIDTRIPPAIQFAGPEAISAWKDGYTNALLYTMKETLNTP